VWTLIDGGPGSGVYKSTDAGETWRKVNRGLPDGDKGRIGLAISEINPEVLYAIVEASGDAGGFFRSEDGGEHWSKQSSYVSGSPQYYQEIYADPHKFDRIYSMDTYMMVSEDGGKTFTRLGEEHKHVDNHAMYIDPEDANHLIIGCDGGLYETWVRGKSYRYFPNLPITQFYKVGISNDEPFYYVYGGTQDNNTQGGPVRTNNTHGIRNSDWFITLGGDGFDPAVDPENPNIVYSQLQYGVLVRFDRATGERIDIKPRTAAGGPPLRWNWDSALLISPHSASRIYFTSQIVFQSDDRGNTWRAISPDLTRDLDRNQLEVMDRVWSVDAVAKNRSTSPYGTIVAFTESPLVEGLLYAGTDDGLIQVTEDGGENWLRIDGVPGVPEMSYVNDLEASLHDPNTVYATFNNHKKGDFLPYVYVSADRGRTWTSITGDLPERGSTYTIVQDHVDPNLLFVGTEFGVFASSDGGGKWVQLKSGIPTISVRELEIQRRENDLVLATFGRGFYVLDDYTPLRDMSDATLAAEAKIFPIKDAWLYVQAGPLGGEEKASQGACFYTAPNPPYGGRRGHTLPLLGSVEGRGPRGEACGLPHRSRRGRKRGPSRERLDLQGRPPGDLGFSLPRVRAGELGERGTRSAGRARHVHGKPQQAGRRRRDRARASDTVRGRATRNSEPATRRPRGDPRVPARVGRAAARGDGHQPRRRRRGRASGPHQAGDRSLPGCGSRPAAGGA
jgi:photosystem II stability/assembly factor-like uncharacterized protein